MSDMMYQKKLVGKYKMLLYKIWKNAQNMCRTLKIKYRRLLMEFFEVESLDDVARAQTQICANNGCVQAGCTATGCTQNGCAQYYPCS